MDFAAIQQSKVFNVRYFNKHCIDKVGQYVLFFNQFESMININ